VPIRVYACECDIGVGNNESNPTRPRKPFDSLNRPPDPSTYSDGYELLFFQNSGFRVSNGFPFFYWVSTRPVQPMFKKKKKKKKTLTYPSYLILSLSLLTAASHLLLLPRGLLPPSSLSRPLHHLWSSIQILSRLFLLLHGLATTSIQI
jgi:hypothetical protein